MFKPAWHRNGGVVNTIRYLHDDKTLLDFIAIIYHSLKQASVVFTDPSRDVIGRRFQLAAAAFAIACLVSNLSFVIVAIVSDFANKLWFYLAMLGIAMFLGAIICGEVARRRDGT